MKILYLDIDGVLNSQLDAKNFVAAAEDKYGKPWHECPSIEHLKINHPTPEKIELLNKIIRETQCQIVLSSTWRMDFSIAGVNEFFAALGIEPEVMDKTPKLGTYRGTEILCHLGKMSDTKNNKFSIKSFCVLDDDYDAVYPFIEERWVKTDPFFGLTEERANKAIHILNEVPFQELMLPQ